MKSNGSCWICRIRHKKCDELHPTCRNCDVLGLSCLYSERKPEWMDSGQLQRQMGLRLKAQVKRNAKNRRGRLKIQQISREIDSGQSSLVLPFASPASSNGRRPALITPSSTSPDESVATTKGPDGNSQSLQAPDDELRTDFTPDVPGIRFRPGVSFTGDALLDPLIIGNEQDLRFIMTFKDYIFPLLHPFYHPSFFEGGHNWVFALAMRNAETCQLIVSLATYFLSVVPVFPGPGFQLCSTLTWHEVENQSELAVKGMQRRVEALGRGVSADLVESIHLLGDIMLLLEFETMTQSRQGWTVHLDAAIALMEQILASPEINIATLRVPFEPEKLSSAAVDMLSTTDARTFGFSWVAFRFFASKLVVADIIASSMLERSPRLQAHHDKLLGDPQMPNLNIQAVMGCENWVYLAITEIIELDVWKKQTKRGGTFSFLNLVKRAGKITESIDVGLTTLAGEENGIQEEIGGCNGVFSQLASLESMRPPKSAYNTIARIWANAAKLYLLVLLSEWQSGSAEILELVSANLELIKGLKTPSWLLTLAWPLYMTGCLATKEQEAIVLRLFEATKALVKVGALPQAIQIAEAMWQRREEVDTEVWDMTACLKSLDIVPLLM